MAWSTRELAELAGTTVNTVRHYHRLGLLETPERRHNGYKQYGVTDLVRLLRIRRLADLGVPLSQIGTIGILGDPGGGVGSDLQEDDSARILRELDAELAAGIERLQKARLAIAAILRGSAPADAPAGFESVAGRLSEADRSIIHIYTQLYDDAALADLRRMLKADNDPVGDEITALLPNADESTRRSLAQRLAPSLAQNFADYPWLTDPAAHLSKSQQLTRRTMIEAMVELYNPAQLDVLGRASVLANKMLHDGREADPGAD